MSKKTKSKIIVDGKPKSQTPGGDTTKPSQAKRTGTRICLHPEQARRRQESNARNALTAQLTPSQRLNRLDYLFGRGVGASRERARLTALLPSVREEKDKNP